jgi:hypothetical protein
MLSVLVFSFIFINKTISGYLPPSLTESTFFGVAPLSLLFAAAFVLSSVFGIPAFFTYSISILRKEFRFYLAKACFTTALDKRDTFKQIRFFDNGLQEYNKYLKRHLKHQIKDIGKIFSRVSLLDNDARNEVICTHCYVVDYNCISPLELPRDSIAAILTSNLCIFLSMKPQSLWS